MAQCFHFHLLSGEFTNVQYRSIGAAPFFPAVRLILRQLYPQAVQHQTSKVLPKLVVLLPYLLHLRLAGSELRLYLVKGQMLWRVFSEMRQRLGKFSSILLKPILKHQLLRLYGSRLNLMQFRDEQHFFWVVVREHSQQGQEVIVPQQHTY